jgi:hypothetical protein
MVVKLLLPALEPMDLADLDSLLPPAKKKVLVELVAMVVDKVQQEVLLVCCHKQDHRGLALLPALLELQLSREALVEVQQVAVAVAVAVVTVALT